MCRRPVQPRGGRTGTALHSARRKECSGRAPPRAGAGAQRWKAARTASAWRTTSRLGTSKVGSSTGTPDGSKPARASPIRSSGPGTRHSTTPPTGEARSSSKRVAGLSTVLRRVERHTQLGCEGSPEARAPVAGGTVDDAGDTAVSVGAVGHRGPVAREEGEALVVAPVASSVDPRQVQEVAGEALVDEAQRAHEPRRPVVGRLDVGLDAVQTHAPAAGRRRRGRASAAGPRRRGRDRHTGRRRRSRWSRCGRLPRRRWRR